MKENMFYGATPLIFQRADELRSRMTAAEEILWNAIHINEWHLKFRRQHPIASYITDFYCHAIKLVIEIDGEIHDSVDAKKNDDERELHLKDLGLTVIRFKNSEIITDKKNVLIKIGQTIKGLQSTPNPPLGDGGRSKDLPNPPLGDGGKSKDLPNPPLGDGGKGKGKGKTTLYIIKIGGNIIDDTEKLSAFLKDFASIGSQSSQSLEPAIRKILVHGGGKLATQLAEELKIPQQLVNGRRITDAATLKIVTMVYAGYINKNIVAVLQANGCNAIGITGADANAIQAHKRTPSWDGGMPEFPNPPSGDGNIPEFPNPPS
ncbi:MAG: DUF559 domain-containing protein, partial [Chitinophagaceae bacterium]|nr:DUF559 domain-containing protein [Chitinophagaceae bacterium]